MLCNYGLGFAERACTTCPIATPADALKLWARLCRQCVPGHLVPADALKLWARLRRQCVLSVSRPPMLCNYGLGFAEHVCPCPLAVSRCSETMG